MTDRRLMMVFGTRPEAIKMAPLILAFKQSAGLEPIVVVTAQHRAMLDQVLGQFGITPDFDLDILRPGQSLAKVTTRALQALNRVMGQVRPDMVMVQGDTTTSFVGALAAFYHRVAVAHVEAGLRTGNAFSPYPEEINRRLTSQLTALHLAPTPGARDNLMREGIPSDSIVVTGNTVIDALLSTVGQRFAYGDPALADLDEDPRRVVLATAHRRESWGEGLAAIGRALASVAVAEPDVLIVFPIHRNPVVRKAILPAFEGIDNIRVVEPLAYGGFARLMKRAYILVTDSGGIQEEGPSLGKPVLVMRDTTERPEAVEAGTVRLVGTNQNLITKSVLELLRDPDAYEVMANAVNPYGDGQATRRTTAAIRHYFGVGPPPDEFGG
jgi:UDP-N-acetylglucosamine 2-epimerase (non-hydrolysing)